MLMYRLTNRWLKECVQLNMTNYNDDGRNTSSNLVIDGSLVRFPLALMYQFLVLINFLNNSSHWTRTWLGV
jgi:hypothetical protein